MSEVLDCPFCGSSKIKLDYDGDGGHWHLCVDCGARGPTLSKYDGAEGDEYVHWNTRFERDKCRDLVERWRRLVRDSIIGECHPGEPAYRLNPMPKKRTDALFDRTKRALGEKE